MTKILVVDDDPSLRRAIQIALSARGNSVDIATNGQDGVERVALTSPELVLLDLELPDIGGLEVLRRIRAWTNIAVIVLTAAGDEESTIAALDGGADDYVTKPFSMPELEARIRVALRHQEVQPISGDSLQVINDSITIDLATRRVEVDGMDVELTSREFDLLAYLARNAGRVCTHQMILRDVWGRGYGQEIHYLRVYTSRLRRKLHDEAGAVVKTLSGVGYQLVITPPTSSPKE
ncbi:MAG: response regulator transcription factor [Ferrimicrobium sp.]